METQLLVLALVVVVAAVVIWTGTRGKHASAIFEQVDRMTSQINELTLRVVELELDRAGYRLWTAQLRGQIVELGYIPVPPPPRLAAVVSPLEDMPAESVLVQVYGLVTKHFSTEEIDDLAFTSGIPTDAFGGESKPSRARELVEYAVRHGKLSELVKQARRQRPLIEWPYVSVGSDLS